MKSFCLTLALLLSTVALFAQVKNPKPMYEKLEINMFPKPQEGYVQKYIQVPKAKNEDNLKVEFFVGKELLVDVCNQHFMGGDTEEKNLEGWGYNYYVVNSQGVAASTLMGCLDESKKNKFVNIPSTLCRYNSRLPIVIYVPVGMEVRYRVWRTDEKMSKAK